MASSQTQQQEKIMQSPSPPQTPQHPPHGHHIAFANVRSVASGPSLSVKSSSSTLLAVPSALGGSVSNPKRASALSVSAGTQPVPPSPASQPQRLSHVSLGAFSTNSTLIGKNTQLSTIPGSHQDAKHHYVHHYSDEARVLKPRHPFLAFGVAIFTTLFFGPFAFILLVFWYNRYTRAPACLAMGLVMLLQGAASLIAGIVVRNNCWVATQEGRKSACDVGYGFVDHTAGELVFNCKTDCNTIMWACGGAAAVLLLCGAIATAIGVIGEYKLTKMKRQGLDYTQ